MESEHDQAFLQILREEKNITNFLDAFFGFLYRCTDFYVECGAGQKLGFPPGITEKLVLNSFHKWKNISQVPAKSDNSKGINSRDTEAPVQNKTEVPVAVQEIEVETCENDKKIKSSNNESMQGKEVIQKGGLSDSYNGAVRENYTWSQSISDIDVIFKLPSNVKTAKDIKVTLETQRIKIEVKSSVLASSDCANVSADEKWISIFDKELCFKTKKDQSFWCMVPGGQINIHLEKGSNRWWEALVVGEPKIELSKIDCTQDLHDMGSEEQMKIQELMWNQQQKLLGKPTSEEIKMEQMLKKAWDAKGSPFEGTPYDPSMVKFN